VIRAAEDWVMDGGGAPACDASNGARLRGQSELRHTVNFMNFTPPLPSPQRRLGSMLTIRRTAIGGAAWMPAFAGMTGGGAGSLEELRDIVNFVNFTPPCRHPSEGWGPC
jgi:1,6-anhydro-N-acetylmuramate kinase